jgi:(S)-2-hydroxy-acid oxidase
MAAAAPVRVTVADFETDAGRRLDRNALDYYASGADDETTLRENQDAFARLLIRPRVLVDVSRVNAEVTLFGARLRSPICIAPTAFQRMAHPDGELAMARAAQSEQTPFILSTLSTTSLEDVAAAAGATLRWFQLYVFKDRALTLSLVRRAEAAGYRALVVTVDTPQLGRRVADVRNKFRLPSHLHLANFERQSEQASLKTGAGSGLEKYTLDLFDRSLSWAGLRWLRSATKLPIIVKGVLTAEDAEAAVAHGMGGIIVSNHGGRQLDFVASTIEALPEVVAAVKGRVPVFLDGGVRRGTDVFKALALGAKLVFLGRPVLWGLSCGGEQGVRDVLRLLNEELLRAMALAGCPTVASITRQRVVHVQVFRAKL